MRRNIPQIFAILLLTILVLCSGCVMPGSEKPVVNGGLSQITVAAETSRISFEDAHQKLKDYEMNVLNESANVKTIYYIHANDVDESGNASRWVFGVKNTTTTELLIYNGKAWTVTPWIITTLPSENIGDQTVSPGNLFTKNKAVIQSTQSSDIPERRDLELQNGIYKLTMYSGNTNRVLMFNATTGALIL